MMKVHVLLLAFISFSYCTKVIQNQNFSMLSKAFVNITKRLSTHNRYVVVINSSDVKMLDSVITKSLRSENSVYTVIKTSDDSPRFCDSAILTFDSVKSLEYFNDNVELTNNYSKAFQFFVHCKVATIDEIEGLTKKPILQFQYFVVENQNSIQLLTFVWYTPESCNKSTLIEVNSFDKKSIKWENEKFFIEKFTNFYGCTLAVVTEDDYPAVKAYIVLSVKNLTNLIYARNCNGKFA